MRTTLTLDDDVAAKLKDESRRSGRPFKDVVNDYLRLGLLTRTSRAAPKPFRVKARDMGALRAGPNLDNVGELLEQIEGSARR